MLLTKFHTLEDSSVLINKCIENLIHYLTKQNYPKQIVDNICDLSFINDNPSYYLYYPYLFNSAFGFYNDTILRKLSIAGFLYYKSIIYTDDIFDNKKSENVFHKFTISNICQEEVIKLLSSIFDIDSIFWKIWNKRKFEYFKAYQLDKVNQNIKSYNDYEILADYKSSFGKIAIDAIHIITEEKYNNNYKKILESHKFFYVAFQILDDIYDYEEDYHNEQFNISRFELEKEIKNISEYNVKDQKKLLYSKNIANGLYDKSLVYLNKSFDFCNNLNANKWKCEIQSMHNTVTIHKLNVYGFIKFSSVINNLESKKARQNTIKKAIEKAKSYIINKQESNGSWEDYLNNAGVSDVWTTAYITYFLSKNNLLKYESQKSKDFILLNYKISSTLGYNIKNKELQNWYSYQNNDGGFSTYRDKQELTTSLNSKEIKNIDGWLKPHFCVSAVASLVFSELKIKNHLISNLKITSYQPYWWTSSCYSLSFLIMPSSISDDDEMLLLCYKTLTEHIKNNRTPENEFYLSLLISAFCLTKDKSLYDNSILHKLVSNLLKTQKKDGSWVVNYSLRIPSPHIINPNIEVNSWDKNNKGTNILVKGFHRLFTTVSCLSALNEYNNIKQ